MPATNPIANNIKLIMITRTPIDDRISTIPLTPYSENLLAKQVRLLRMRCIILQLM
jgi:hypothetical protein